MNNEFSIDNGARVTLGSSDVIRLRVDGFSTTIVGGGRYERTEVKGRMLHDLRGARGAAYVAAIRANDRRAIYAAYRQIGMGDDNMSSDDACAIYMKATKLVTKW